MKRNLLSAAIGALFVAGAGQALAAIPAYSTGTTTDIYISGATAQDNGILAYFRRACNTGTLGAYNLTGSANFPTYLCTTSGYSKANIAVHKSSAGGSGDGVQPVSVYSALSYVDLALVTASPTLCSVAGVTASVAGVAPDTVGLAAYTTFNCAAGAMSNHGPDFGFSDVEPRIFNNDSPVANLTTTTANQLLFGVPVTVTLRNALQSAQGLTSGAEDSANTPSLSDGQVAGIYSGLIATGDGLGVTTNPIYVARRVDTSGSEKAAEIYFLNQGILATAATAMVGGGNTVAQSGGTYVAVNCGSGTNVPVAVFQGGGSGDVRTCLNTHNTGGRYGVGVLSMESQQNAVGTNAAPGWRYVKLNGVMPTIANAIRGSYRYYTEQAINVPTTPATNQYGADAQVLKAGIDGALSDSSVIVPTLNKSFTVFANEPAGQQYTGIMGLPNNITGANAGVCSGKFSGTTTTPDNDPINVATYSAAGGGVDSHVKPAITVCPPRF